MKFELRQQFQIESARRLIFLPTNHPCARVHGHSFTIILVIQGPLDPKIGWVKDYHTIETLTLPWRKQLDHALLNDVPGLENPTSENLALWVYERARKDLPELVQVIIRETSTTECRYPISNAELTRT